MVVGVAWTVGADTAKARYVRLTVTASRPAPAGPPFYGGRSWQICDWTLMRGGKALGWSGAKVLQPDRGLVKGEGPSQCLDGNPLTKFHGAYGTSLVVDLGREVEFDAYTFTTGNDAPGRDPSDWMLDAGVRAGDSITWKCVGHIIGFRAPDGRRTVVTPAFPVDLKAEAVAARERMRYWTKNRAQEQMRWFNPAAAARSVAHLKAQKGFDAAPVEAAVKALTDNEAAVRKALDAPPAWIRGAARRARAAAQNNAPFMPADDAVRLVENYRKAMLLNPILDFGELLCIRRNIGNPGAAFGGRICGFLGLNAHNHWDMNRTGYDNDIVVVSDLRGTPTFRSLYKPKDTAVVRDLDLDFDASRILFTSYRGTNNLFGVYEIEIKSPPSAALSAASQLSAPSGLSAASQLSGPSGLSELSREATLRGEAPLNNLKLRGEAPLRAAGPLNLQAKLVSPEDGHYDIQWWDGCYLPNKDQVVMLGTGAYQFLPCEDGNIAMCVLYRIDRKTGEVRQLTYEQDSDYTPTVTHDGRIMFTRWEYSDIPHFFSRILMTMNPDGIGQLSLWGSGSWVPTFFYKARCVPGDPHLITMFGGGHHDRAEVGRMYLVDPTLARAYPLRYDPPDRNWGVTNNYLRIPARTFPKEKTGLVHEFPGWGKDVEGDMADGYTKNQFDRGKPYFSYPYPLDARHVLATVKTSLGAPMRVCLVDVFDNITILADNPNGLLCEAMPFRPRPRPPVIPDRSVPGKKTCSVHIADIYTGTGLAGVPRGAVKRLRVFSYHFNYHKTGGHSTPGLDRVESGWDVKRVLGTVDVEEDGSCCFEMPANTPISLQPLDADGAALQLMRSWVTGMPGERVSCTGCHEDNRSSVKTHVTIADAKYHKGQIQKIKPVDDDGVRPWGFAAEMWPVVHKNCLSCHGDEKTAPLRAPDQGGAENKGLRFVMKTAEDAYRMLHPYVRRPGPESEIPVLTPLDYHVSTSPLVQMLWRGHHGVKLEQKEMETIYTWIDLNAPWKGKWDPPAFETDRFVVGCTNQVERRKQLAAAYANITDDPEAEYDRYLEIVNKRLSAPAGLSGASPLSAPAGLSGASPLSGPSGLSAPSALSEHSREATLRGEAPLRAEGPLNLQGWPMNANRASELQLGRIDQVAPVTTKTVILGEGQSMTFRLIPAGTFVMGRADGRPDERPAAVVDIAKPFWLSETEVRNDQYAVFDPEHDSGWQDMFGKDHAAPGYPGCHRRMPVVRVSWNEAAAFCAWLSKKTGEKAALPTEAQWEWAARAGTDTLFPWGGLDDDFSPYANFADADVRNMSLGWEGKAGAIRIRRPFRIEQNFPLHEERWKDDWFNLNYVARADANLWGLYDMHGNAAEWTCSDYAPYPYKDDDGRNSSGAAKKAVRGGSFASRPRDGTSSCRLGYWPWQKVFDVGFRVALEADDAE
jgi:formylglycine-generating enzyme required for sulfatase activity